MVPYANRIPGNRFAFDGAVHEVRPNNPPEPVNVHGDGWRSAWRVAEQGDAGAVLTFESRHKTPFDYRATQTFSLADNQLTVGLNVENLGPRPMPFGLGLHPWFARRPGSKLAFKAECFYLEEPG